MFFGVSGRGDVCYMKISVNPIKIQINFDRREADLNANNKEKNLSTGYSFILHFAFQSGNPWKVTLYSVKEHFAGYSFRSTEKKLL